MFRAIWGTGDREEKREERRQTEDGSNCIEPYWLRKYPYEKISQAKN